MNKPPLPRFFPRPAGCLAILFTATFVPVLQAAKYDQAHVTRVFNEVRILKGDTSYRQAEVGAEVNAVSSVATSPGVAPGARRATSDPPNRPGPSLSGSRI